MKRAKKSAAWYNTRDKGPDGSFLGGRQAGVRCGGPYPDPRAGLRLVSVYPDFQAAIL